MLMVPWVHSPCVPVDIVMEDRWKIPAWLPSASGALIYFIPIKTMLSAFPSTNMDTRSHLAQKGRHWVEPRKAWWFFHLKACVGRKCTCEATWGSFLSISLYLLNPKRREDSSKIWCSSFKVIEYVAHSTKVVKKRKLSLLKLLQSLCPEKNIHQKTNKCIAIKCSLSVTCALVFHCEHRQRLYQCYARFSKVQLLTFAIDIKNYYTNECILFIIQIYIHFIFNII
jgi:hypothetical protein